MKLLKNVFMLKREIFHFKYLYKILIKFSFVLIFIILILFLSVNNIIITNKRKKMIFTFWEPHNKIPGYIQLCIKTWKKYLSDYEIKILDLKSIKDYLGQNLLSKIISEDMSLQMKSDAIRIALLQKFGGIWLDADTIITNNKFLNELNKYELVLIGDEKYKSQHIGFILASYNSRIIKNWLEEIINKVVIYKKIRSNKKLPQNEIIKWNYIGNGIIDQLLKNETGINFFRLDEKRINAFPELNYSKNSSLNNFEKYRKLYFQKGEPKIILNNSKGIILLHNSWTPFNYKTMSEYEFLSADILLSNLLSIILDKKI